MKVHAALLLLLLPFITRGMHVNIRGASRQDKPKSIGRYLHVTGKMGMSGKDSPTPYPVVPTLAPVMAILALVTPVPTSGKDSPTLPPVFRTLAPVMSTLAPVTPTETSRNDSPTPPPVVPTPTPEKATSAPVTPTPTPAPVSECTPFEQAHAVFGASALPKNGGSGIYCLSNTDCTISGQSCLFGRIKFFCGDPTDPLYTDMFVMCDYKSDVRIDKDTP
jgi:hypothetical protein